MAWGGLPLLMVLWAASPGCRQTNAKAAGSWDGWEQEPLEAAAYFELWHHNQDRLLLTFGPGGPTDTTGIFGMGKAGSLTAFPKGTVLLATPLERVVLASTTHASFLSALGKAEAAVGCAHLDRLRDTTMARLAAQGKLLEVASSEGVDRERVLLLTPQALFVSPYMLRNEPPGLEGLPMVPIAEYLEPHPLGRAEWIRAVGLMMGAEERARTIFEGIAQRYRNRARRAASEPDDRPVVFFGSSWRGTWSVPSGNSYMAQLIHDAGAHYVFADTRGEGNIDLDPERVLLAGQQVDWWGRILGMPGPVSRSDVAGHDARVEGLPAFQRGHVFYGSSAQTDLFGQAALEPDVVLADLIALFHPGSMGAWTPVYFKQAQ